MRFLPPPENYSMHSMLLIVYIYIIEDISSFVKYKVFFNVIKLKFHNASI